MLMNIERELSGTIPNDLPSYYSRHGEPAFTVYGCIILERYDGNCFTYTVINLKTGKHEVISRQRNPLKQSGVPAILDRIRHSSVSGAAWYEIDRNFGETVSLNKCLEILEVTFREVFPQFGYPIHEEQISLSREILEAISQRKTINTDSEDSIEMTFAYLTAAVLAKRGRLNGFWNMGLYADVPYIKLAHMPIVIAASCLEEQKTIYRDFIPALSNMLIKSGIISTPLTAVLRKGREHYICKRKLLTHISDERKNHNKKNLQTLLDAKGKTDLDSIEGLSHDTRQKISVPKNCDNSCPHINSCRYLMLRNSAQSPEFDIQVVSHNLLFADVLRRHSGQPPLIPNFQTLIIDDAHRLLSAARSMYSMELSCRSVLDLISRIKRFKLNEQNTEKSLHQMANNLSQKCLWFFEHLLENADKRESEYETNHYTVRTGDITKWYANSILNTTNRIIITLITETGNCGSSKTAVIHDLRKLRDHAETLSRHDERVFWLEKSNTDATLSPRCLRLRSIPKDLGKRLYNDVWSKGVPTVIIGGIPNLGIPFEQ